VRPFSMFDAPTAEMLYNVIDAATLELAGTPAWSLARMEQTRLQMTTQLIAAAENGERDPVRLKQLALDGINRD
jgi:hypothetical protein